MSEEDKIYIVLQQAAWLLFLVPSIVFLFYSKAVLAATISLGCCYFDLPSASGERLSWILRQHHLYRFFS